MNKTYEQLRLETDSDEEVYAIWWLEELLQAGYIEKYERSETYQLAEPIKRQYTKHLKTRQRYVEGHVAQGAKYTPDFKIYWTSKALGVFATFYDGYNKKTTPFYCDSQLRTTLEIKGMHDRNREIPLYTIKIKWLFQVHGIFVHMVKMPKLFNDTFTPMRYMTTNKSGKARSMGKISKKVWYPISLDRYVMSLGR